MKSCSELGEQFAGRGKSIRGTAQSSRHIEDKTVQTGRIIKQRKDASARRGRGDPPRVHPQEPRSGEVEIVIHAELNAPVSTRRALIASNCGHPLHGHRQIHVPRGAASRESVRRHR